MNNIERDAIVYRFNDIIYKAKNVTDINITIEHHYGECPTIKYAITENIMTGKEIKTEQ